MREAVPLESLLERALLESKYYEKKKQDRTGLGISAVFHGAGFTGSGERYLKSVESLERVESGKFRVLVSRTGIGQATNTFLSQIVAVEMGIAVDDVQTVQPDTDLVPDGGPNCEGSASCRNRTGSNAINAVQIWILSALADVPTLVLIRSFCLMLLKKRSTCQRAL